MKVRFKINKTLTAVEEMEMVGLVEGLEQTFRAEINREERMLFTIFDFTTSWKGYQEAMQYINKVCRNKPFLTVL